MLMMPPQNECYLSSHWYILLLGISVVLVDIQHYDGVRQSECCIGVCKRLTISLLQYKCYRKCHHCNNILTHSVFCKHLLTSGVCCT